MSRRTTAPIVLVTDDAVVIRTSEVLARLRSSDVKSVAEAIGVGHTVLWRFLDKQGIRRERTVTTKYLENTTERSAFPESDQEVQEGVGSLAQCSGLVAGE